MEAERNECWGVPGTDVLVWERGEEGKRPLSAAGLQHPAKSSRRAPLQPQLLLRSRLDVLPGGTAGSGWAPSLCSVSCAASRSWICPGRSAGAAGRSLNRQQHLGSALGGSGSIPAGVSACSTCRV